jgi:hypothetical protein
MPKEIGRLRGKQMTGSAEETAGGAKNDAKPSYTPKPWEAQALDAYRAVGVVLSCRIHALCVPCRIAGEDVRRVFFLGRQVSALA